MKHALVLSDWWSSVLVRASSANPNLNDPINLATIKRLANRYDIIVIVSPDWHTVGTQVRDRLREAAREAGRTLTLLRYAGSLSLRWGDQTGAVSVVPVSRAVTASGVVTIPAWTMRTAHGTPIRSIVMGGASYLLDPGCRDVIELAKIHLLNLASGWDGVFIDEVGASYAGFQFHDGEIASRYPVASDGSSPTYELARRSFQGEVTSHLAKNGKLVAANINANMTSNGFFPSSLVRDSPGLSHPFIEVFGTTWQGSPVGFSSLDHSITQELMTWLRDSERRGRIPIVNAYTRDPATLRYALALFLASSESSAAFSGNIPGTNDEYSTEPVWLKDYEAVSDIGNPVTEATSSAMIDRTFENGRVIANLGSASTSLNLGGTYRSPSETADTARRTIGPLTGVILSGKPFGQCPEGSIVTPGAIKLVGDTWCKPRSSGTINRRTNLWSNNPAYRINLNGWTAKSATMSKRVGGPGGLGVLRLAFKAGSTDAWVGSTVPVSVSGGTTLHLSAWVKSNVPEETILAVEFYGVAGEYLHYDYGTIRVNSIWSRVARSVRVPVAATCISLTLQYMGTAPVMTYIDMTGWLLEDIPGGTYFDGSTPPIKGTSYSWRGAANVSPSAAIGVPTLSTASTKSAK